jgi:hypothetical protein
MPNTRGAINLGGNDHGGKPSFDSLSERDKADLAALAESTGTDARTPVQTMFLVVIHEPGTAIAYQDTTVAEKYAAHHPASVPEMKAACGYVDERIHDSMLSQAVVATQMQMAAQVQRQAEDAQLIKNLNLN